MYAAGLSTGKMEICIAVGLEIPVQLLIAACMVSLGRALHTLTML